MLKTTNPTLLQGVSVVQYAGDTASSHVVPESPQVESHTLLLQEQAEEDSSRHTVPEDKVAVVSRGIREALQARSAAAYLRPIVTSHAITGNLEGALAAIKEAKEAQLLKSAPGRV